MSIFFLVTVFFLKTRPETNCLNILFPISNVYILFKVTIKIDLEEMKQHVAEMYTNTEKH